MATQLLNYCTHAIEFFQDLQARTRRRPELHSGLEQFLIDILGASVKFMVPLNGYFFEHADYMPNMFELQRLPYPVCALEFAADETLYAAGSGLGMSKRRIAVAFVPQQLSDELKRQLVKLTEAPDLFESLPDDAMAVMSIYDTDAVAEGWGAALGFAVLDLSTFGAPVPLKDIKPDVHTENVSKALGRKPDSKYGLPVTYYAFPFLSRLNGMSLDQAHEALIIDLIDETRAIYQFCAAINCVNVGVETVSPSSSLNAKRKKHGKLPFFEYKVLDLAPAGTETPPRGVGGYGRSGEHASPRTHLRRGHIRRLKNEAGTRAVWVNATIVNPGARAGIIDKTYNMR